MSKFLYDETSISSIVEYAQRLEHKSIDIVNFEQSSYAGIHQPIPPSAKENSKNKGNFGNYLEEAYFGKKNDNKSQADFPLAKLELKASPLKTLSNHEVKVKERLVLGHFTFSALDKETFTTSHFIDKNQNILFVFYHYDRKLRSGDLKIELSDLWQFLKEDLPQIQNDWETIVSKIRKGKAHEISEGDTLYLGACTKGTTAESSMQVQPYSDIKARGRALCFKLNYINHIFQILLQRRQNRNALEMRILSKHELFENHILQVYKPYLKKYANEICTMRDQAYNPNRKDRHSAIARSILGLNKDGTNIYELNASGITVKTIRVEPNEKMKESMSFKAIDYCEIVDEEWEESYFYGAVTSKFLFVIFKRDAEDSEYYLDTVKFWQIPMNDYTQFEKVWNDTKQKVSVGDYSHFMKISDNPCSHIRPHGRNATDLTPTPQGTYEKKMCFWINRQYLQEKVLDKIYKK